MNSGGSATLNGCYFNGNSASSLGNDIYRYGSGTVNVNPCIEGYTSTQGSALSNYGVSGTTYSYSACNVCPDGTSSPADGTTCSITCPSGRYASGGMACAGCEASKNSVEG